MAKVDNTYTDRRSVELTASKTLTPADSGVVQVVNKPGLVITLPATANGLRFAIQVGRDPLGSNIDVNITPAAGDGVTGGSFTAAINKSILAAAASSKYGDTIVLVGTGTTGVTAWIVDQVSDVFTRQP